MNRVPNVDTGNSRVGATKAAKSARRAEKALPLSTLIAMGVALCSLVPILLAAILFGLTSNAWAGLSAGAFFALLVGLVGTVALSRMLSRPLLSVGAAAKEVAKGNLRARVSVDGYREAKTLGELFNKMTLDLGSVVARVDASLAGLSEVSEHVAQASKVTADDAKRQAESGGRTVDFLVGLSTTFDSVSLESANVLTHAEETLAAAETGGSSVEDTNQDMVALAEGVITTGETAQQMADIAYQISEMTGMIQSIADETKILAVNAAIEAARAGESGQGFAIVATHIRSLADSVSSSANRISGMVSGIERATQEMRRTAATQAELATKGVDSSRRSKATFDSILFNMRKTVVAAREIAEGSSTQQKEAEGLISAVKEIGESTQGTASAAGQLATSAQRIKEEVEALERSLSAFVVSKQSASPLLPKN